MSTNATGVDLGTTCSRVGVFQHEQLSQDCEDLNGSDSEEEEIRDPNKHKAGTILQIKLINFMCHSSFEIEFGPRVNFVIGPNGSGKSAILTALVVAFGARAAVTSRAKKMDEFIKYGERTARVIVKLHNYNDLCDKDFAYKPTEYGKVIIIEKIISRNESTRLLIKNERGKIVAEKRFELDAILEFFRIQVDNPVCILNQEVSKTFLHSKKPEDKFSLFMKATLLEQIRNDYSISQEKFNCWKNISDEKKSAWKRLKGEKFIVQDKIESIKNRDNLEQRKEELNNELAWSGYKDLQRRENEAIKEVIAIEEKIRGFETETKDKKKKIEQLQEDIESARLKIETIEEEKKNVKQMITSNRTEMFTKKEKKKLKEGDIKRREAELKSLMRDKKELETKIKELQQSQSRDKNSKENEKLNREKRIVVLETEIRDLQSRETSTRTQAKHLETTLQQIRSEVSAEGSRKADLNAKVSRVTSDLNRITQGKENSIRRFGEHMIDILKEIDRQYASGKFKKKPIGPLGHYIKLMNKDIAAPLEVHLRNNLYAFACDSILDMQVLTQLLRKSFPSMKPPQIIVRPFGKRHDISRQKVRHETYESFADLIDIENDVVFNVLIDKCNLEHVLYIPSYEEAENTMMNPNLVPRNCRCAYTKDACVMYPKTTDSGYRSYANDNRRSIIFAENVDIQIRELEDEKKSIEELYAESCRRFKNINDQYLTVKSEYDQNDKKLRSIFDSIKPKEMELLELKHVIDDRPVEVKCFEDELTKTVEKIEGIEPTILNYKSDIELIATEVRDHENKGKELQKEESTLLTKIQDLTEQISRMSIGVKTLRMAIEDISKKKLGLEEKLKTKKKESEELMKKVAELADLLSDSVEVKEPRPVAVVEADLKKVKIHLDARTDYEDPHVEMENLKRRLLEIDSVEANMTKTEENVISFNRALRVRKAGFKNLRSHTISKLSTTFSSVMDTMNMRGELLIYVDPLVDSDGTVVKKANTLEIRVDTNYEHMGSQLSQPVQTTRPRSCNLNKSHSQGSGDSNTNNNNNNNATHMSDTRSLSGGERSFSTVAFVLALWKHCASPFKLLDEIDVFMDMVTRRISYNALINFASMQEENTGQFIFFSPLELPKIQDSSLVRVFEMPAPHRQIAD